MTDELRRWLDGPVLDVAPRLLGAVIRHVTDEGTVAVRLSEVEAYAGADDPGSHAYRGRTARNAVMFGPPGHLYVYFTYGMHHCCNVVVGREGSASAVLLRAGAVIDGADLARRRRGNAPDRDLARGPARLCVALGIDRAHDGTDLSSHPLTLSPGPAVPAVEIVTGPRVGLRGAPERPWRFWIAGDPTVSVYRPAAKRKSGGPSRRDPA